MNAIAPTLSFALSADAPDSRRKASAREEAPPFSYALAAASLEDQASKSLKAHGAAPQGDVATNDRTGPENAVQGKLTPAKSAPSADTAERTAKTDALPRIEAAADRASNAPPVAIAASPLIANSASALTGNPSALQPVKSAEAIAARDAATAARAKASVLRAARPTAPAALKSEFAEILAKRFEKTSVFELRLDPPELGRVEGRLTVNDDGKAVLSLTFDNQNAFDLFSRDEAALKHALAQAGLDFAAGDFVFAFRERDAGDAAIPADFEGAAAAQSTRNYDPVFLANWSAGALDIRI